MGGQQNEKSSESYIHLVPPACCLCARKPGYSPWGCNRVPISPPTIHSLGFHAEQAQNKQSLRFRILLCPMASSREAQVILDPTGQVIVSTAHQFSTSSPGSSRKLPRQSPPERPANPKAIDLFSRVTFHGSATGGSASGSSGSVGCSPQYQIPSRACWATYSKTLSSSTRFRTSVA